MVDDRRPLVLGADTLATYAQRYSYDGVLLGDSDPRFPHAGDGMRARGYVLPDELYEITRYKSPRRAELIHDNRVARIEELTGQALALKDSDPGRAARILTWLKGIGIPTASAVLAVADPMLFGIVDFRVWDVLHRWQPKRFPSRSRGRWPIRYYLRCLVAMRELAQASGLSCREVDMALWQMDKEGDAW